MFYTLIHIKCIHSRVLKTHVYETAVSSMDTRCPPEPVPVTDYCLLLHEFNGTMPPERFKEWQLECLRHVQDLEAWRQWQTRDKELKAEALDAFIKEEAEALALRQEAAAMDALHAEEEPQPVVNEADGPLQAGGTAARSKRIRWSIILTGKSHARRLLLFGIAVNLIQEVHVLAIRCMY